MKKKGYAIVLDSLVALLFILIIFGALFGTKYFTTSQTDTISFKNIHYISEDILDVLNKQAILDDIGGEWAVADGNTSSVHWENASNISKNFLEGLIPDNMGYKILIDGNLIYSSDTDLNSTRVREDDANTITYAQRLLIGYESGMPTRGHVARAFLKQIKEKITSEYAYFGGFVGNGNISRFIDLPDDAVYQSTEMELNVGDEFDLFVNGVHCGTFTPSGGHMEANIKVDNLSTCSFGPGRNSIRIEFTGDNITQQYIGGGFIAAKYKTGYPAGPFKDRFYFPGIEGFINLYSSFYIPATTLYGITGYLHYNRPVGQGNVLEFKVGSNIIYESAASGEIKYNLTDSNFTDYFSHSALIQETIPIRMSVIGGNGTADVVLTTDLSNSMSACMGDFITESSWDVGECGGFLADFNYGEDDRLVVNSGTWDVDNNTYYQHTTSSNRMSTIDVSGISNPSAGNFTASFRMRITQSASNNYWAGMLIRKQDEADYYASGGYLILYEWDGTLRLYESGPGNLQVANLPITPQEWRTIGINTSGNNIRVSVDGTEYINYNDTSSPYLYGHFSLVTNYVHARFDDIHITPVPSSPGRCPLGGICYYFDTTEPGFLYGGIKLHNITSSTCDQWAVVPNCGGGSPYCYCTACDSSTRYQIAECGGQTVGGTYDACCDADCCAGVGSCCARNSWGGYSTAFSDCGLATWAANNLTHCRAQCSQWSNYQLGNCSTHATTNTTCVYGGSTWRTCDEGSDPPGSPGTGGTFCYERIRSDLDSDMAEGDFTTNCNALPEPLSSSTLYETEQRTCDGDCSNPEYLYCTAQYKNVQIVGSCPSGEYCQCFIEGATEVCYEFDRTLRGYRRYWRDCQNYYGRGWWTTYTNASQICYDCTNIDQFYTCRSDYVSAGMDDSTWGTVTTVDSNWMGCDRCSRFYRRAFNIADVSVISSLTIRIGSDDGAICYINDRVVHYDPEGHGWSRWNWELDLDPSILVNGQNIIACQVKEYESGQAFNLQLEADTGMIIDEGDNWLYHHQEEFCGGIYYSTGTPLHRYDPDSSSCEYGVWVDDCGNAYPANQTPMSVSAWTWRADENHYEQGLMFVGEYLAGFLGGEYIENESSYGSSIIPASFWDSADVLIVDGNGNANFNKAGIKNALNNGKIVITNYNNFLDIHNDAEVGSPGYTTVESYDFRSFYFRYNNSGILIGDQYAHLAYYWYYHGYRTGKDGKRDKAANLLNAIYPIWYRGNDSNHVCPGEYCIPDVGEKGCRVCNITRLGLAQDLDRLFANEIITNTADIRVGLVGYGSGVCSRTNLTRNSLMLNDTISNYTAKCGYTCISCAIEEGIDVLNESNAKKKYLIIMSDGEANTCIDSSEHSCDNSPYGAPDAINETLTLAHMACNVYNISVYTIGFGSSVGSDTLNKSATCGGKFYQSDDPEELKKIYENIAKEVVQTSQTVATEITNTTLYNDSYIEFDYEPYIPLEYGEIELTYISPRFNNTNGCNGTIYLSDSISNISDFKITSYSSYHWTDFVRVIDPNRPASFDMLNDYSDIYINLGDPYVVYINPRFLALGENNTIQILTGDSPPHNVTNCSADNRAIYTIRVKGSIEYGGTFTKKMGCNWTIQFEDDTFIVANIPEYYNGTKSCTYTEANVTYDPEDAVDEAVYRLLDSLDTNKNNKADIKFDSNMMDFSFSRSGGIRSLWGPIILKLIVWM